MIIPIELPFTYFYPSIACTKEAVYTLGSSPSLPLQVIEVPYTPEMSDPEEEFMVMRNFISIKFVCIYV